MGKMIYRLFENCDYSTPEIVSDKMRVKQLYRAIEVLPTHSREVLLMWGIDELTPQEIAEALGISEKAVYSRLSRAKKQLRKVLGAL